MAGLLSRLIGGDLVFSCTGRGVCESCDGRHMAQTAAHRVIRVFSLNRLLDAAAVANIFAWENSGSSIDARVRITLIDRVRYVLPCHKSLHGYQLGWHQAGGSVRYVGTTQQLGPTSRFWKTLEEEYRRGCQRY